MESFHQRPSPKETKEIIHPEVMDLFDPIQKLITQLKEQIEAGEYKYIIGDDASGRIPALIFHNLMKRISEDQSLPEPELYFLAGSGIHSTDLEKEEKVKKLEDYIKPALSGVNNEIGEKKKILIITDTVNTGSSLKPLTEALKKQGVEFDIATIALLDANTYEGAEREKEEYLGAKIFYAKIDVPRIYENRIKGINGVRKNPEDILASRNTNRNSRQLVKEAREDVKILSDQIYDWYKQKFPKVTGDQKAFAES